MTSAVGLVLARPLSWLLRRMARRSQVTARAGCWSLQLSTTPRIWFGSTLQAMLFEKILQPPVCAYAFAWVRAGACITGEQRQKATAAILRQADVVVTSLVGSGHEALAAAMRLHGTSVCVGTCILLLR